MFKYGEEKQWYERATPSGPETSLRIECHHSGGRCGTYRLSAYDGDRLVHSASYAWNVWRGHCSGQLLMPDFVAEAERKRPDAAGKVAGDTFRPMNEQAIREAFAAVFSKDFLENRQQAVDGGRPFDVSEFAWMVFNQGLNAGRPERAVLEQIHRLATSPHCQPDCPFYAERPHPKGECGLDRCMDAVGVTVAKVLETFDDVKSQGGDGEEHS